MMARLKMMARRSELLKSAPRAGTRSARQVMSSGCEVSGVGCRVWGLGFRVEVQYVGFKILVLRSRVMGLGLGI